VLAQAHLDLRRAGTADEDAKIRRQQNVGVAAGGITHLDSTVIHSHHQAGGLAQGNAGVGGQFDGSRGADAQYAAMRQCDLCGLGAGGYGAAGSNDGPSLRDLKRGR